MSKALRNVVISILAILCIIYPIIILTTGFFPNIYTHSPYLKMLVELIFFFLLAMIGIKKRNVLWLVSIGIIFSYLHMMLLPMLSAALYTGLTLLIGMFVNEYFLKNNNERIVFGFFSGLMVLTIIYAVLSIIRLGDIRSIRIFDGIVFILLLIWYFKKNSLLKFRFCLGKFRLSTQCYILLTFTMIFLMLAIGRANISLDYDSLWYGLRSPYVLSNNTGIYENLKLVGCVYTYPKGYEVYELPLASTTSYGYIYAGNIFLLIFLLYIVYRICNLFIKKEKAMLGVALVSAVPGITNMSITAKPDIMTLLIQLMSIFFFILYIQEKKGIYLGGVASTYIYAQTLKTTAMVFSTSILLLVIFICIVYRIKPKFGKTFWYLTVISLVDLIFIWLRTFLLTGIPATSVWGKLFRAVGMTDKYPYSTGQISQFKSENIFSKEVVASTLNRIKEFFLAPNSSDTDHVIIAWGTTLCIFIIISVFFIILCNLKMVLQKVCKNALVGFMGLLFLGEFFGCILTLWILLKPDGNYFMLFYAVTIIVGVICLEKICDVNKAFSKRLMIGIYMAFILLNICITGMTNWAWKREFSEINWLNRGFFNHQMEFKSEMNSKGCIEIYDILASDDDNKVLAYGQHPQIERFPCITESDLDVNYWGNQELMSNQNNFLQFIDYAEYDYILIWAGYIQNDSLSYLNLLSLFDLGKVADLKIENHHILISLGDNVEMSKRIELKEKFEQEILIQQEL